MSDTEAIVRNFYAALGRGDALSALALLDGAVEWTEAERSPYYAGTTKGVDAVVKTVLEPINRDFEDFVCAPSDFITQGDRTASFGCYTGRARRSGEALSAPFVHVWTVRGGKIARFVQYTDSAAWAGLSRADESV